jgi:histidine ammonia-lyase
VLSERTAPLIDELRRHVDVLREDRVIADDIEAARRFALDGLASWTEPLA